MTDLPAVLVEMGAVAAEAEAAGAKQLRGRALAALAEATLWHSADAVGARRLAEEALEVLQDEPPVVRFEALHVAYELASWVGDSAEHERFAEEALLAAREAERKDLETVVIHSLVMAYTLRFELAKAGALVIRGLELADASGSAFSRAAALSTRGWLHLSSERFAEAEADYEAARELYEELGNMSRESSMLMMSGRAAFARGDDELAEKRLREAERSLRGLGDRGALCEAQRSLAMVLATRGSLDEAERYALQARETVGPDDRVSVSTTALGLAFVRAAQGRDAEAEILYLDAIEGFARYDLRSYEHWALRLFTDFLRDRARDDEAEPYEARRAELNARSTAPIV
jgi:tetratricopeptide (TPR) repeat protein